MKIVNIIGGLGNQMFQYSFALSLKKLFPNEEVLIDISHYNHLYLKQIGAANLHNGYEIDRVFPKANILKIAKPLQLMKVTWYIPNYFLSRIFRKLLPQRKTEYIQPVKEIFEFKEEAFLLSGNMYYEGIWESYQYLEPAKEEIKKAFSHPAPNEINAKYIEQIESCESIGIHVRRGDYLKHPAFRGTCGIDYYQRAIEKILSMKKKVTFFIFSNDLNWCKKHIQPLVQNNDIIYVTENTGPNSCWDMFLMTHCKHLIIANSSFSWWGAFLNNRGGNIIAPKIWMNREAKFEIWPKGWIKT